MSVLCSGGVGPGHREPWCLGTAVADGLCRIHLSNPDYVPSDPSLSAADPACAECDGSGFVSCVACDGDSGIECSRCAGTGICDCDHCGAEHDCGSCHGEGSRDCEDCKGTGEVPCACTKAGAV